MCGRLTLTVVDIEEIAQQVEARVDPVDAALYQPRYNAAPSVQHWMVQPGAGGRVLIPAIWGMHGGLINVRAETASRKFAAAFANRRVAIPADGFYEWSGKQPILFRPREGGVFLFAGVAESLPDGRPAFAVMTMAADGEIAQIHDRMPVILPRDAVQSWLEDSRLSPLPGSELISREVSLLVNNVRNDSPELWNPPGQLALF